MDKYNRIVKEALEMISDQCPRLVRSCYWAGTSAISIEELGHRISLDIDFHTHRALQDVRPILAEMQRNFSEKFRLMMAPDEFGSGFRGILQLTNGEHIVIEVLSNFEDVPVDEVTVSKTVPRVKRITLSKYLADKIQCVAERAEARDLVDIRAVIDKFPKMKQNIIRNLLDQDALLLAERLLAWSDESIADDLAAYPDVDPEKAIEARNLLLKWLKDISHRGRME